MYKMKFKERRGMTYEMDCRTDVVVESAWYCFSFRCCGRSARVGSMQSKRKANK